MNIKKFVASRIKDHKSNIVTQMWNIQQKLDDVIAMGRGDTDLDTPRPVSYTHLTLPTNREV